MEISVPSLLRIKPDALNKIGKYLRSEGFTEVALFWGEGMKDMLGERVGISFDSSEIKVLFEKSVWQNAVEEVFHTGIHLPQKTKAVVGIGGGVVIDTCKYIGFQNHLPIISVPTAISNDGFCSPLSSLLFDGKKRTFKTAIPYGVIVDTTVLQKAPERFLYSGIGDLFCKKTAIFDWKLSYKKTGEYVNDFAATISGSAVDTFLNYPQKTLSDKEYIRIIASSLLLCGISMEIAGSSRPASGSEHLISHAYDKIAQKSSMHGIQVGVASLGVAYLQEQTYESVRYAIVDSGFLEYVETNPLSKTDFIEAVKMAQNMKEDFYTILSEKGSIEKLLNFVDTDEMMQKMVR